jgi:hypothetical protein
VSHGAVVTAFYLCPQKDTYALMTGGVMVECKEMIPKKVAIQLTTDEGAFICNIDEADVVKMKQPGALVILHHAIRLDAMMGEQYEIYRMKIVETSSIAHYQSFHKEVVYTGNRALCNR